MSTFDLYGILDLDIDAAAVLLQDTLGVPFIARDSSFKGEYYSATGESLEEFELWDNFNKIEQDWAEPEFTEYPVLLYVAGTQRAQEIEDRIKAKMGTKAVLLQRKEFSD